jgi:hypothetical protein
MCRYPRRPGCDTRSLCRQRRHGRCTSRTV